MAEKSDLWAAAFGKAQTAFPTIPKSKTVDAGSYSYKYADLASILELVNPALHDNGLAIGQEVVAVDDKVGVTTRIYHESGHVESFGPVYLKAGGDARSAGSAITYARRYSLTAALGIATEEDDDGSRAVREEGPPEDVGAWLATRVRMFTKWTDEERRETVTQVMREQGVTNPMSRQDAETVFEKTAAIYYETHPTDPGSAPF